jgi:hypothetical protein
LLLWGEGVPEVLNMPTIGGVEMVAGVEEFMTSGLRIRFRVDDEILEGVPGGSGRNGIL